MRFFILGIRRLVCLASRFGGWISRFYARNRDSQIRILFSLRGLADWFGLIHVNYLVSAKIFGSLAFLFGDLFQHIGCVPLAELSAVRRGSGIYHNVDHRAVDCGRVVLRLVSKEILCTAPSLSR